MSYKVEVLQRMYPVLSDYVYHYIAYKEIITVIDNLPGEKSFWVRTCDSHIKSAITSWTMIFGTENNNSFHWRKLAQDSNRNKKLLDMLDNEIDMTSKERQKYSKSLIDFRNEFVVHRDLDFNSPTPFFSTSYEMALILDKWIRELIKPDFLDFERLEDISENYRLDIQKTIIELTK